MSEELKIPVIDLDAEEERKQKRDAEVAKLRSIKDSAKNKIAEHKAALEQKLSGGFVARHDPELLDEAKKENQ